MNLLTVTIGRNVRAGYSDLAPLGHESGLQVPMRRAAWFAFRDEIRNILETLPQSTVFGPFNGTGEWEGVTEESLTFTALVAYDLSSREWQAALDDLITSLASEYDQDAIAWAIGESHLSGPNA